MNYLMNSTYIAFLADSKGKILLSTMDITGAGATSDAAATNLYSKLEVIPSNVIVLDTTTYVMQELTDELPF